MKKINKSIGGKALVCGFLLAAAASLFPAAAASEQLPQTVLRLHVIANSNSPQDQAVKLAVRDAVLEDAARWYGEAKTRPQAEAALQAHLGDIARAANHTLRENGAAHRARVELCSMYFPTRTYGSMALPAGTYRTLRVVIGKGEGQNWWCVVFPALCIPAAQGTSDVLAPLSPAQRELVEHPEEHRVAFKVVEWVEHLRSLLGG